MIKAIKLARKQSKLEKPQKVVASARSWTNPIIWDVTLSGRNLDNTYIEEKFTVDITTKQVERAWGYSPESEEENDDGRYELGCV